jgi:ABC-type oligopeptide transport system substrate-binding subunit
MEDGMTSCVASSRRDLFLAATLGAVFNSGCGTEPRNPRRLRYLMRRNIDMFDPMQSPESFILSALFEPLVEQHPETMEPIAGLATHYRIEDSGKRYTFYLRGHSAPSGIRLAAADSLPVEFSQGRPGTPYDVPAQWSDGQTITAEDCVYSWQRYFDPRIANPDILYFFCIAGAKEVCAGKIPPDRLGVRALGRFEFQVDLWKPAPYFLMLCCAAYPAPRHVIEQARREGREASWTEPARIVTSGPFRLKEYRPHERTIVARNPQYFDAALVGIDEIEFAAGDGVQVLNLFRAGLADSMEGRVLPLQLAPRMKREAALHVRPACASHSWRISTNRPPWDNLILRYALNMATDKEAVTRFLGMGQLPAKTRVPAFPGYTSPASMPVVISGRPCDVLEYNPRGSHGNCGVPSGRTPRAE